MKKIVICLIALAVIVLCLFGFRNSKNKADTQSNPGSAAQSASESEGKTPASDNTDDKQEENAPAVGDTENKQEENTPADGGSEDKQEENAPAVDDPENKSDAENQESQAVQIEEDDDSVITIPDDTAIGGGDLDG